MQGRANFVPRPPSLAHRQVSKSPAALAADVLVEARSGSGTWSLATHRRITEMISGFRPADFEVFLGPVLERLCAQEAPIDERFKLCQLCTMVHQKASSVTLEIFDRARTDLMEVLAQTESAPLGRPISRLVFSLFEAPSAPNRDAATRGSQGRIAGQRSVPELILRIPMTTSTGSGLTNV
jgi:hypothetical protein